MKSSDFSVRGQEQHHYASDNAEQLLYKSIFGLLVMVIAVCVLVWF